VSRESSLERAGQRLLEAEGWEALKVGHEGWPDRLVLMGHGVHAWVEWKAEDGDLTPAQRRRIPRLRANGELVVVADRLEGLVDSLRRRKAMTLGGRTVAEEKFNTREVR
jgi:hypothetical protein